MLRQIFVTNLLFFKSGLSRHMGGSWMAKNGKGLKSALNARKRRRTQSLHFHRYRYHALHLQQWT